MTTEMQQISSEKLTKTPRPRARKWLFAHHLIEDGYVPNRTTLARWVKKGLFPAPVELGPNSRAWPVEEIDAHREALKAKRRPTDSQAA